jgi:hypothetical protein
VINDELDVAAKQLLAAMAGGSSDTSTRNRDVRRRVETLLRG